MNDRVAEAIKHRHPKEWVFFWLIALLSVAVLLILLLLAIFRTDVIEVLQNLRREDRWIGGLLGRWENRLIA